MRYAAGQLAEGFHSLRATGLRLQLLPGRHVHHWAHHAHRGAARVPRDQRPFQNVRVVSVGRLETVFPHPAFVRTGQGLVQALLNSVEVLRMNMLEPETDSSACRRWPVAK